MEILKIPARELRAGDSLGEGQTVCYVRHTVEPRPHWHWGVEYMLGEVPWTVYWASGEITLTVARRR